LGLFCCRRSISVGGAIFLCMVRGFSRTTRQSDIRGSGKKSRLAKTRFEVAGGRFLGKVYARFSKFPSFCSYKRVFGSYGPQGSPPR
jgi:hypothetical protein